MGYSAEPHAAAGMLRKYGALALVWSALVGGSLAWDIQQESRTSLSNAAAAARADISKDIIFRKWATSHGGVYVAPTEHTPSNPYLKVPERDVVTTTGKKLTLMNPAYMLREMQTDFPGEYGMRSHITSLKLLNPQNAPDAWETVALQAFEKGEKERLETTQIDGKPYLRVMRPLIAEKGCLKCHGFQGYKEGDVRGGLSTTVPLAPFLEHERELSINQVWTHGTIWLIGLLGIGFAYRNERRQSEARDKVEAQLRTTSLYTRTLIEASLDPLVTISAEGKITDVNAATEKVTGRNRAALVGTDFSDYFTEPGKARSGYQQVFREGSVTDYPLAIRHENGHVTEVLYNASVYRDEAGKVLGVFAAARDVTERKKAELGLHEKERHAQSLLRLSRALELSQSYGEAIAAARVEVQEIIGYRSLWIYLLSEDGKYLKALAAVGTASDYVMSEEGTATLRIEGDPMLGEIAMARDIVVVEDARTDPRTNKEIVSRMANRTIVNVPIFFMDKHLGSVGSGTFGDEGVRVPNDAERVYLRSLASHMAVTLDRIRLLAERKRDEDMLREKEERLALATIQNGVGVWDWNLVTQEMIWDDSMYALYHVRREDFGGTEEAWRKSLHPEDLERADREVAEAISGVRPFNTEFRVVWPGGEVRHIKAVAKVFRDEQGKPLRMLGINMDVTERKRAEEVLLQSEAALKEAQRIAHLGSWHMDLVTNQVFWSEELYKIYGYDPAQPPPLYTESMNLFTPESWERLSTAIARAAETGAPYELELEWVSKEGVKGWMLARGELVRDAQGKPARMRGVVMDITARKKAELELRELNNDFVTLLENTGDFIYFKDQDSRIIFCSQTMAAVTGHQSWRDMVGKHDLEIFPAETARIYYEEELPIFREGKPLLNKTDPYYDEQGRRRWVNTNKWPVFGEDGRTVLGIFGISRDITELKEAEDKLNELNRDLERRVAERTSQLEAANKELEAFSYSVSHDLRTPLRAIDGFSRILLEDYSGKLDEEGQRLLNVVRENSHKMEQLIDDILKFSRAGRLDMTLSEIDMESLVQVVFDELKDSTDVGKLKLDIWALPRAMADRPMLHQVVVNLLSNAIKFSRGKDDPRIEVGGRIEDGEAVYYVKDNGAGFDMQYADRLFGVFQRLHAASEFEGTGIGLAIVKRIVTRHGGRVWAEGKMGEGATFYFSLPAATGEGSAS